MTIDAEKPKARRHRDKVEAFHTALPRATIWYSATFSVGGPGRQVAKAAFGAVFKAIRHAIHRRMLPVLELDPML